MAPQPIRLFLISLLAGVLAACTASGPRGSGVTPAVVLSAGPTYPAATCPLGSDPDAAGPAYQARPAFGDSRVSAAFDRQSRRIVLLDAEGDTWTFDVCANTWEQVATRGAGSAGSTDPSYVDLLYDPVDDLTYALDFADGLPSIRFYDVETAIWTRVAQPRGLVGWNGAAPRFVMDPTAGVIYGYQSSTGRLRVYDVASNTWTEVQQRGPRPPTHSDVLATFDPTVGRIVLHVQRPYDPPAGLPAGLLVEPGSDVKAETWTFDPGTRVWERHSTQTPTFCFGYSAMGTEMAYDEYSRASVVFADGSVATFDAAANRWTVPRYSTGWPPEPLTTGRVASHGHGLVCDVVNGRVLVLGGSVRTPGRGWQDGTDVWAYDVSTNTWAQLVPPRPN